MILVMWLLYFLCPGYDCVIFSVGFPGYWNIRISKYLPVRLLALLVGYKQCLLSWQARKESLSHSNSRRQVANLCCITYRPGIRQCLDTIKNEVDTNFITKNLKTMKWDYAYKTTSKLAT